MKDTLFIRTELIGLDVEVLSAPYSEISGKVVDETKNTFTIESIGSEILHRPEDRIKKVR